MIQRCYAEKVYLGKKKIKALLSLYITSVKEQNYFLFQGNKKL